VSEAAESLWRFSLAVYAAPGVAPRLLMLQERHGLDVNLALLCAWLGWSGRGRVDMAIIERAERAVAGWRDEIVVPLRAARRALRGRDEPAGAAALREEVKRAELEAERLAQHLLVAALPQGGAPEPAPEAARRDDAAANLRDYCDLLHISPESLDFIASVLSVTGS
jgi:uncharacterized protein (TIGR02444 family)